jgi:predicted  nucleic acid-binding Zn-ribbon protein
MNPELSKLIQLDKINQEIARLNEEVAALPRTMAQIEAKLAGAKKQVEDVTAAIKASEADKRKQESDIKDWQQKIIKFREQSSSVKTNDQYRALMHEIEYAEKEIGTCEENILVGMEAADALSKKLVAANAELKQDAGEVEKEKAHARAVTAEDEEKLAGLNGQAAELKKSVDSSMLAHYERVAAKRKGAIVEAFEQKCSACNVFMRPQRYQELLSGRELVTCDSCGRILYADLNHHPEAKKSDRHSKGWYFVSDGADSGRFYAFSNSKTSTSMRVFDAASGSLVDQAQEKKTTFQDRYADLIASAQPLRSEGLGLDEHAEKLSPEVLEELQLQAQIAPPAPVDK